MITVKKRLFILSITSVCVFLSIEGQTVRKPAVAIMDLRPTAITTAEAKFLTDRLVIEIQQIGKLEVLEREKMDEILKEQGFQQSGSCDNTSCLVEVGRLLPVEKIIGGSVGRIGSIFSVQLRTIDIQTGTVERTSNNDFSGSIEQLLTEGVKEAALGLFGIEIGQNRARTEGQRLLPDEDRSHGLRSVNVDSIFNSTCPNAGIV